MCVPALHCVGTLLMTQAVLYVQLPAWANNAVLGIHPMH